MPWPRATVANLSIKLSNDSSYPEHDIRRQTHALDYAQHVFFSQKKHVLSHAEHVKTNLCQTTGGFVAVISARCHNDGVGKVCVLRYSNGFDVVDLMLLRIRLAG